MFGLFDKSMEALREIFVRSRFVESNHFDREDVEEWLEEQHQAAIPDQEYWRIISEANVLDFLKEVGSRVQVKDLVSLLTADSLETLKQLSQKSKHDEGMMLMLYRLLSFLPEEEVKIFGKAGEAIWLDGFGLIRTDWQFGSRVRLTLCLAGSESVPGLLFTEWTQARSNFETAREILCDALAVVIANVRCGAEEDFDKAVAVSVDGKKIVCADEVWVVWEDEPEVLVSLPAERFVADKILFEPSVYSRGRQDRFRDMGDLLQARLEAARTRQEGLLPLPDVRQTLVTCSDGRVFVTDECFVPSGILGQLKD